MYFYKEAGSTAQGEISAYIKDRNRLEGMKNDKIIAESTCKLKGTFTTKSLSIVNDRLGPAALISFSLLQVWRIDKSGS